MIKNMNSLPYIVAGTIFCALFSACATAPKTATGKAEIVEESSHALSKAKREDDSLGRVLSQAVGYAVFPSVGKGGLGIGGAYGKGVLFQNGAAVGYCDLTQVSIGFQFGGQAYTEIIVFASRQALDSFKSGNFTFNAQATAVAIKSGAGANAKFLDDVAVFTMNETGLMYEAAIGGQKFSYQAR